MLGYRTVCKTTLSWCLLPDVASKYNTRVVGWLVLVVFALLIILTGCIVSQGWQVGCAIATSGSLSAENLLYNDGICVSTRSHINHFSPHTGEKPLPTMVRSRLGAIYDGMLSQP